MPPILGNAIALLFVALLVAVCVRNLRKDAQSGGCCSGCAGCGGCHGGACAHCDGIRVSGPLPDISGLRLKKEERP